MDFNNIIQTLAVYALPVIFAITIHEAAHGYVAQRLGDPTAAMLGRVTLNPLKHIDPIGTILMPVALLLLTKGAFVFGYAKPVPVRFDQLRHPKRDMISVAAAGPVSNLIQALLWGMLLVVLVGLETQERFFVAMAQAGVLVNVLLAVFNLFPVPPLDGGRVLVGLLPTRAAIAVSRIEPYGFFIVVALVLAGVLSTLWIMPLTELTLALLNLLLAPLKALFS
ncbi:MAG: site-2 protease family protein [Proteobacteria bacterium]|nr:site-2 protease family protein [Pseudomonadota bacterium]